MREVIVHDRRDCCQKETLPLLVEVSADGQQFRRVGRRRHEFSVWAAPIKNAKRLRLARFVRVRGSGEAPLGLAELEIYE